MVITGCVLVDLTCVPEDRQRSRVAALAVAPKGAAVELVVGALRVNPDAARLVRQYAGERHLSITVKGESHGVGAWVGALRTGAVLGMLL